AGVDHTVSVATGAGVPELLRLLHEASGAGSVNAADLLVSHERDRNALLQAQAALSAAADRVGEAEIAAEDLRRASAALERLLGRMDAESVLDRLFSTFCIGK
ncbi:MAG: tRNA uridine-5-carboxymethylaminomethyl(34) synthesis GTPase MnmE, partial [Devosia sp.]